MLNKIIKIIYSIIYLPVRYLKFCIFCKTQMRAQSGFKEDQEDLVQLYMKKNDYINAYAWSYVLANKGVEKYNEVMKLCKSKLGNIELVKAIQNANKIAQEQKVIIKKEYTLEQIKIKISEFEKDVRISLNPNGDFG